LKLPEISPGVKYIIISTIFFALMNIGVKYLKNIPAYEIVFFRGLVTLIVGYFLIVRRGLNPWGNNKKLLLFRGTAGTIALLLYFYTLQRMPLASAVTIQYLSPIFTIIIAGFMLKEPARPIQWLFFLISFAGVLMIKGFDTRVSTVELIVGVTSALFSGLAYNFIRKLKDFDHPLVVVFYFPLVTVPVVGIYTIFNWVTPDAVGWAIILMVGLATTIAQVYMTKAYQVEKAANISNFNYLGSIYALVFGYLLFGEVINIYGMLGIGLIIFGVAMCSRCNGRLAKAR
jgi:drug/metabolite transporter (DMT)-like permease